MFHFNFANHQITVTEKKDGSFRQLAEIKNFVKKQADKPICYFHHQHQAHRFHLTNLAQLKQEIWADSVITNQDVNLCMTVADCFPVILYEPEKKISAMMHCGWKPLLQNIIELTILDMKLNFACQPAKMLAWIGPGIHSCCYKFKQKPLQNLLVDWQPFIQQNKNQEWEIDLAAYIHQQLLNLGIRAGSIEKITKCTSCSPSLYSYFQAKQRLEVNGRLVINIRQKG